MQGEEEQTLRPGFNLACTYKAHVTPVRKVLYNPAQKCFLSLSERSLKTWVKDGPAGARTVHDLPLPTLNFITGVCISTNLNLVFTSCLDDTLKLYNERLRLKSTLPWANGVVREMVYNSKRNELITAGSYGVKARMLVMAHVHSLSRRCHCPGPCLAWV